MDLIVAKILSALALWILSLCFGVLIPFLLWRSRFNPAASCHQNNVTERANLLSSEGSSSNYNAIAPQNRVESPGCVKRFFTRIFKYDMISFINCCCGGLFLGICFLELLPESRKAVEDVLTKMNVETSFPVTDFLVTVGLLLVMIIEQAVFGLCIKRKKRQRQKSRADSHVANGSLRAEDNLAASDDDGGDVASTTRGSVVDVDDDVIAADDDVIVSQASTTDVTRSLILVAMLSVHSIFEGLAIGLETQVANVIQLIVAVSVHKCLLAFGLGVKLLETFSPHRPLVAVICALIFCTGSPLGCAIGIVMSLFQDDPTTPSGGFDLTTFSSPSSTSPPPIPSGTAIASAFLECLATGTFLYVTFIEVIPLEFSHAQDDHVFESANHSEASAPPPPRSRKLPIKPFFKLISLTFGFCVVVGLQFI